MDNYIDKIYIYESGKSGVCAFDPGEIDKAIDVVINETLKQDVVWIGIGDKHYHVSRRTNGDYKMLKCYGIKVEEFVVSKLKVRNLIKCLVNND